VRFERGREGSEKGKYLRRLRFENYFYRVFVSLYLLYRLKFLLSYYLALCSRKLARGEILSSFSSFDLRLSKFELSLFTSSQYERSYGSNNNRSWRCSHQHSTTSHRLLPHCPNHQILHSQNYKEPPPSSRRCDYCDRWTTQRNLS